MVTGKSERKSKKREGEGVNTGRTKEKRVRDQRKKRLSLR